MRQALAELVESAAAGVTGGAVPDGLEIPSTFEVPPEEKFGDLSSPVALRLAKRLKKAPKAVAEDLGREIEKLLKGTELGARIAKVSLEGPGFINFHFSPAEIAAVVSDIHAEGENFGRPKPKPRNILLEFVSANPTGPLTVAHGRQAALGDSLARVLKFCGHEVTREYYNNDEGVQIQTLGRSTHLRVREILESRAIDMPENFYQGEYLKEIAQSLLQKKGKDAFASLPEEEQVRVCETFAKESILEGIQKDLADFDVHFNGYYSQAGLMRSGRVERTLEALKKKGVIYENEGAVWLRSTDFADDKDRVLIKSDKSYTYLTPDIAYHDEKFERGFGEVVNIWGPDHHGYIARLKASQVALGHDAANIHILIAQLVTLYEGKKQVRMSTRAGEFVTLRQILDEVGRDAGRFFFLMRKFDAHLDFDLELAKTQTPENPVFYIQYANARIESIKTLFGERKLSLAWDAGALPRLTAAEETRLMRLLSHFGDTVLAAERTLEPYRLVPYLMELAAAFHKFYTEHRVVTEDASLTQARMMLVLGVQSVIRSGLGLLGVSTPAKM